MPSPRISIDSPLGPQALVLQRLQGVEELGRPYHYALSVLAQSDDVVLGALLGHLVTVHVELNDSVTRHFGGVVTRISALGGQGRSASYRLELRPWLSLLEHTANCRIFQQKSAPDVIKKVFRDQGFTDFDDALTEQYRVWEYLVQYRESDFNFVSRLMEQEGIYFFWRHEAGKHTLVLADSGSAHERVSGYENIAYAPAGTSAQTEDDYFDAWSFSEEIRAGAYVLNDFDFKKPKAELLVRSVAPRPEAGGVDVSALEVFDYPGEYSEVSEGESYVRRRLEETRNEQTRASAEGNVRGLYAGALFSLIEHPRSDQNQEYLVTKLNFELTAGDPESSGISAAPTFRVVLSTIANTLPYRPGRKTAKPRVAGLQTATVVGKQSEEIWTDEYGRVKVQFHWDREGKADENSSCWIRVAQQWAGSGFGSMHIPRIGQEVIVEFVEGDPDRPLITGRVYNNDQRPPYTLPENQTQSGIKSRSTKGGSADNANEIRFEDKKGAEELFVQAEKQHTVKVKQNRSLSVGGSENITVSGTRSTEVTKKNTETYKDEHEVTVTGKVTETYQNEHKLSVTSTQTIEVTADKGEHVTGTYELTTDTAYQLIQGGTTMKLEGDAMEITVAKSLSITRGSGTLTIDESGAISMESGAGIVIKCGASTVEITSSGISLNGQTILAAAATSEISLDPAMAKVSGTAVNIEATGIASVAGATVKLN